MAKLAPETALQQIADWLAKILAEHLRSLVCYGSFVSGDHHAAASDINLLCVLDHVDGPLLDQTGPAARWWRQQGNRPFVLLSEDELRDATDVFPIEYLDMQRHHRLLKGEDLISGLRLEPALHRLQVERELRAKLVRLRGAYLVGQDQAATIARLMIESLSTFLTLFRHALYVLHEPMPETSAAVLAAVSSRFNIPVEAFQLVLAARRNEGQMPRQRGDAQALFAGYLQAIQRVERVVEQYRGEAS